MSAARLLTVNVAAHAAGALPLPRPTLYYTFISFVRLIFRPFDLSFF
jgi:hypothetical protein